LISRVAIGTAQRFKQEPDAALAFVDPVFEQACGCHIAIFVTEFVQHAHTFNQRSVIVTQLGEHFMRMHKLCIIIENALVTRNIAASAVSANLH
jgi:hypothetical protein